VEFRQKALSKLQSPEELDIPVHFARPQGWLVLIVTLVVMAAAAVWAVTGTVTSKLQAPGVLTHGEGSYLLQSPFSGQVTAVLAKEGAQVSAHQPLVKVRTQQGEQVVRSLAAGRVTALTAGIGSVVTTGADVARIERVQSADEPLLATLYVPGDQAADVAAGAAVDLTVQAVSSQRFGVLRGHVKAVGDAPRSPQQIAGYLGDPQLAKAFTAHGQPVAVTVVLERSATTKSGYTWSTTDGPPHRLHSMTTVSASVHLKAQHPADWLLP
jgi:pyruvate/2-oxoglutarate dehydrogenase complex dihydrolipoamide acyltransferase (E2) component